jgi:diguanylate cyclase (GGDEF)-like protein
MLRALLGRFGILPLTLGLTAASVAASLLVTVLVSNLMGGPPGAAGLAIAIIVPSLVAPFFTFHFLRLLDQLWRAEARLQTLATTDDLTRAFNRRHFLQIAGQELDRCHRYGGVFSLVLFDLDDFKRVNDTYGHQAGDDLLRQVSAVSRAALRAGDTFARYGGEEFGLLLLAADAPAALEVVERLRHRLAETTVAVDGRQVGCTISAGIATCDLRPHDPAAPPVSLDSLLQRADAGLYAAKRDGGNSVAAA